MNWGRCDGQRTTELSRNFEVEGGEGRFLQLRRVMTCEKLFNITKLSYDYSFVLD